MSEKNIQAPADGDVIDKFFYQIIHGDFMADNPDDLRMALEARAAVAAISSTKPKGKAPSLKADDYRAAWEAAKIAWARRTDAPKPWSALSFAEQLELVVEEANRAAIRAPAPAAGRYVVEISDTGAAKYWPLSDEQALALAQAPAVGAEKLLRDALRDAEWCDKRVHVCDGPVLQHWKVVVYLPIPADSGMSADQALDRALGKSDVSVQRSGS